MGYTIVRQYKLTKDNIGDMIFLPCISNIRKDKYGRIYVITFSGEGILIKSCQHCGCYKLTFGDTLVEYSNHKWGVYFSSEEIPKEIPYENH